MPASPTDRFQLIRGEGRGSGKCRAALRALAELPPTTRVFTTWATTSTVSIRLHLDASATTEPVAPAPPPRPTPRLGRDPLAAFIRRQNDWRRRP